MPGTIADTMFDRNAQTLKENIGNAVVTLAPMIEPWFRDTILGGIKAGVEFQGEFNSAPGRSLLMKKRFNGSLSGVVRGGQMNSFLGLVGDLTTDHGKTHHFLQANQGWVDPFDGAVASEWGFTSTLYGVETNVAVPLSMLQLEATPANIKQHVVPLTKGLARNIALFMALSWHADPANQYRISGLGPAAGSGAYSIDAGTYRITFTPTNLCFNKYMPGQSVDLFIDSTTRANESGGTRLKVTVDAVDRWSGKVILQAESSNFGTWATTGNLGDNAYIKSADTYNATFGHRGFYCWKSFAVWGGATDADHRILRDQAITTTAMDYIDIRDHPEFRSGYHPNVGQLTERKLMGILENAKFALRDFGQMLDTGVWSRGIVNSVFESYAGKETFERGTTPGKPVTMKTIGLGSGFQVQYEDDIYTMHVSSFMDDGQAVFMRGPGNWALITPPRPAGVQTGLISDPDLDPVIPLEFPMGAIGKDSKPWMHYLKTINSKIRPTEYAELPGQIRAQFMPVEQIPMLVLEGITTSRVTSPLAT